MLLLWPLTMTPSHRHRRSIILTIQSILTLLIFSDSTTVIAYAKPSPSSSCPPRPTSSTKRYPNNIGCSADDGKGLSRLLRTNYSGLALLKVRCGGTMANNMAFLSLPKNNRRATSLFSTTSEEGDVVVVVANNSSPFDEVGRGTNNDKYHLIWSPKFWKKMVLSMAGWWAVSSITTTVGVQGMSCHAPNTEGLQGVLSSSVVLPLLSSSCCAIQLIINALSGWGCAGFNTFLGPIRPVLLSLLLMSTWKLRFTGNISIGWTIASLLLAFLPELLDIWNTNRSQQWQRDFVIPSKNRDEKESETLSPSLPFEAKVRLTIPTMGCVACVNKVDSSIRRCVSAANNNIREEKSWLADDLAKGGVAEVTLSGKTREEIDGVVEEVIAAVHDAGFVCNVASLQVHER